jgi:hypothetical protein
MKRLMMAWNMATIMNEHNVYHPYTCISMTSTCDVMHPSLRDEELPYPHVPLHATYLNGATSDIRR